MTDQFYFFYNNMKQRKHLTQVGLQNVVRKSQKHAFNSRYIISHMFTSPLPNDNTSIQHTPYNATIPQCLQQLNYHLSERRPIQTHYVNQIKNYLNQLINKTPPHFPNTRSKISIKQPINPVSSTFKSPYNLSLKKLKSTCIENEKPQLKLRKRKMNFQNIEPTRKINNLIQQNHIKDKIICTKIVSLREQCTEIKKNTEWLREELVAQIGSLRKFVEDHVQKIILQSTNQIKQALSLQQLHYKQAQRNLSSTIDGLQDKIGKVQKESAIMKEYLQKRQGEILILWQALNGSSF